MKTLCLFISAAAALILAGCGKEPSKPKEPETIKLPAKPASEPEEELIFRAPPKPKERVRKPLNLPPQEKVAVHAEFPKDVLIPESATLINAGAAEVTYQTNTPTPELIAAYGKWMEAQGWTGKAETAGLQQLLVYKKADRAVTVQITDIDGETTVVVSTAK